MIYRDDKITGELVAGNEGFTRPKTALTPLDSNLAQTSMHGALVEMLRFLRTGEKPQTECHDNIHSLAMVLGAIESAKSKTRIPI